MSQQTTKVTYDYILIGTGTAGSIIAKRLTDDFKTSLLALEAGDNNSSEVPIRDSRFAPPFILRDNYLSQYYWPGKGVPQKSVANKSFVWTGGRTLGGTSSVNNEQYVRPSKANMKQWEKLLGPLWSPTRETKIFKQIENYNGITTNESARSKRGPLNIRQAPAEPTAMVEKLVSAIEQVTGLPRIVDYNDPKTPLGPFTRWQLYQMPNGIRSSSDTAFLNDSVMTPTGHGVNGRRLRVAFKSTATKILFDNNRRAIGVEFVKEGKCMTVYARKKVIVSAGIRSPQLLMLSGIGPVNVLNRNNIPIVYQNENVGKNLTTHAVNLVTFKTNPQDRALPTNDPFALYPSGAFLPDPTPGSNRQRRGVQMFGLPDKDNKLNFGFYLTEPKSKGTVVIQNNDPLKAVLANEGFLSNQADLISIKNVFKIYIKNIAKALNKIDPQYKLITPTIAEIDDDKRLEQYIKDNLMATHHVQGTLRMAKGPEHGVVNARGEVFGVKDLIVADDSIAPFVSDGNTSAPAYFIGANIANILLENEL